MILNNLYRFKEILNYTYVDKIIIDHLVNKGNVNEVNFLTLPSRLKKLKKKGFRNEDKILIIQNDLEFFYPGSNLGFTMFNFLKCVTVADIPLSKFVIITVNKNLEEHIKPYINNVDLPTIFYSPMAKIDFHPVVKSYFSNPLEKQIKFHGFTLLGDTRTHRSLLYQFLRHYNLLEKFKTNYNSSKYKKLRDLQYNTRSLDVLDINEAISRSDNVGIIFSKFLNQSWLDIVKNKNILQYVGGGSSESVNDPELDTSAESFYKNTFSEIYQKFAIEIVTESAFDYPAPFNSEKILRPMAYKTPFVLFGPAFSLENLRSQGFHTFEKFWNESYDQIVDPQDRFDAVTNVIHDLSKMSITEICDMYESMLPILLHNQKHLLKYINTISESIHKLVTYD